MNIEAPTRQIDALLAEIDTLTTQFDIFRLLKRVCALYGYKAFMVMRLPDAASTEIAARSIITNWPADMIAAYDRMKLMQASTVIATLRKSTRPMVTRLDTDFEGRPAEELEQYRTLFRHYGFLTGVALPVHDATGKRGAICMHGDRCEANHAELSELNMLAIYIFQKLADLADHDRQNASPLTERERDCLSWTAEGKTSSEIADILGISEHTVNHYLNRAAKKLDTVNRTQAVSKALRRGWIT